MAGRGAGRGPGGRGERVRVRTARRRSASSSRWLQRQLNDPYVAAAKRQGYRSRAAYKLVELDDRFHFLKPGQRVLDLGAAPGGWTQVAVERTRADADGGHVLAVDVAEMAPLPGAALLRCDIADPAAPERIRAALDGPADVVLSDMAPAATGQRSIDHLRIVALVELAAELAMEVLRPGGSFVAKVWQGGAESGLLAELKQAFRSVRHAKPKASRAESAEVYLVATGFRGEARG